MKKTLDALHQQLKLSSLPSTSQSPPSTLDDLVKKYNLPNTQQTSLEKALRSAVASQYLEDVKFFIEHIQNINAQDTNPTSRKTALHWAVLKEHRECLQALLEAGAGPLIADAQGMSAIQLAQQNNDLGILTLFQNHLLLKYNLSNKGQISLAMGLRLATMRQQVEDVQLFIPHLEHVNAPDNILHLRRTALHWAVIKKNLICVKLLLAADANSEMPDAKNVTPLQLAIKTNDKELLALFGLTSRENKSPVDYSPLLPSISTLNFDTALNKEDNIDNSLMLQINMNVLSNNSFSTSSQVNVGDIHIDTNAIAKIIQQHLVFNEQKAAIRSQQPLVEWNIPAELPYFIERPLLHEQIETHFKNKKASPILALTALSGLGGIGKTQLANHYVCSTQNYTFKAWLRADSKEILQQEYWSLAKELNLVEEKDTQNQVIARLQRWFSDNPGWLLIYDNVKDKGDIYTLLPEKGGHILITSRSGNSWHPDEQIEVSGMRLEEARALVKKLSAQEGEVVDTLLAKLGYLPLAIAHAASYMKKKRVSAQDYLKLYEEQKLELIDKGKLPPEDKHQPLMVAWQLNRAILVQEDPKALEMLEYCSLLNPSNVPAYVLIGLLAREKTIKAAEELWADIKESLSNYSLITLVVDNEVVSVHPLLQEFIRSEIPEDKFIFRLYSVAKILTQVSKEQNNSMIDIYRRQKLLPHILAVSTTINNHLATKSEDSALLGLLNANLLGTAGFINHYLIGNTHIAIEQFEYALVIQEQHYGSEHVEVALTLGNLANAHGTLGNVRQQKLLLEKTLEIFKHHYGLEHVEVAKTLCNLANALGALGDTRQKKALLERALVIQERHYGPEHVEVAKTLSDLANAIGDLGDTRQKKALLERALVIFERHYGPEHVEVAKTLCNLANALGALGDTRQQKALLERALVIFERHYGSEHVEVAKMLMNLANALGALGDTRQQKALLERVLVIFERHYGPEHVEVARTLMNLANALGALGDTLQEKVLLERVLVIQERHYDPEHVELAKTLGNLANAIGELGDACQKKALLERALVIKERHYGAEHVEVAITLMNLANAIGELGDACQKKALLERALVIKERHYGAEHVEVAKTLVSLANALGALGDTRQQKALLERALVMQERYYGAEHVEVTITLGNLANALGALGDTRQQKALLERALLIQERHYGKAHVEVASTLVNLATAHGALGDIRQAKVLLEKALAIFEQHYGKTHPQTATILYNLGAAYWQENDLDTAKMLIGQALAIVVNYPGYGEQHPKAQQMKKFLDAIHQQLKLSSSNTLQSSLLTLEGMVKKYNLPNTEQISLEKALRSAVANGSSDDVKWFIEQVQNINAQDTNLLSLKMALHWAVIKNHQDMVKLLLDAGADWSIKDAQGLNAVQLAKQKKHESIVELFRAFLAVKYKLTDNSQTSLEKGLRTAVVNQGKEPFTLKDVSLFIELVNNININVKDSNPAVGKTALHHAVSKNNKACVKLLLAAGANPEIPDAQGLSVTQYIQQSHNTEMQQLIQESFNKQHFHLTERQLKPPSQDIETSTLTTISKEVEEIAKQNQTISTIEGFCFNRYQVAGDGDCGYTAFGFTRQQAFELVRNELPEVVEILKPVIQEQLLIQAFIDYLEQHQQASTALVQAFAHYQVAAQQGSQINDDIMQQLQRHASDLVVINGYIDYDIRDKRIDVGWSHPCVLQALAHLQKIELYIWQKNNEGQLVPHEHYPHYRSSHLSFATQRTDLLFINGNHFERLELISTENSLQDVAASGSAMSVPMALAQSHINSVTNMGQAELGLGLQSMKDTVNQLEKKMHEEHYTLRVERMQYFIQEALEAYQFIGDVKNDEHRAFQESLKNFLFVVQEDTQFFAKLLSVKGSKLLGNSYDATWNSYYEKAKTIAKSLQEAASKLSQPLDGTQKQLFEKILAKIEKKYAQETIELKASDIRRTLIRKLLEGELNTLARTIDKHPTCFISYSWGPWGRVDAEHTGRVHRLATHLKASGLKVVVDVWDNQVGDIHVFTGKLFTVDKVLVIGSPHLVGKYKNYSSNGESRGLSENYRGNVVAKEITYILQRIGNKPPNNHGIVLGLMDGTHDISFPEGLQSLPSSDTDFAGLTTISMDYITKLFNLLKRLFSEQHHTMLEASRSKLGGLIEQLVSEQDKQRLWDIYEKIYQQKGKVKWDDVLLQSSLDEKRDVDIQSEKSPTGYEEGFVANDFYPKRQNQEKQGSGLTLLSGNYHGTNSSMKIGNIDIGTPAVSLPTVLSGNRYGTSSSLITGNIRVQSDARRDSADKVTPPSLAATQSPFTPARSGPPATLPQKKMLKEVKELLDKDYPEEHAKEDEDTRIYREEVLAILKRFEGHKLNQQEETELRQLLDSLGGEGPILDKKDNNRRDAALSS